MNKIQTILYKKIGTILNILFYLIGMEEKRTLEKRK